MVDLSEWKTQHVKGYWSELRRTMKRDVKHLESFEADQGYRLMCSQEGYPSTMHMKILPVGYNPQGLIDFDEGPLFDQMENPPHQRAYFTRAWLRLQREQPHRDDWDRGQATNRSQVVRRC